MTPYPFNFSKTDKLRTVDLGKKAKSVRPKGAKREDYLLGHSVKLAFLNIGNQSLNLWAKNAGKESYFYYTCNTINQRSLEELNESIAMERLPEDTYSLEMKMMDDIQNLLLREEDKYHRLHHFKFKMPFVTESGLKKVADSFLKGIEKELNSRFILKIEVEWKGLYLWKDTVHMMLRLESNMLSEDDLYELDIKPSLVELQPRLIKELGGILNEERSRFSKQPNRVILNVDEDFQKFARHTQLDVYDASVAYSLNDLNISIIGRPGYEDETIFDVHAVQGGYKPIVLEKRIGLKELNLREAFSKIDEVLKTYFGLEMLNFTEITFNRGEADVYDFSPEAFHAELSHTFGDIFRFDVWYSNGWDNVTSFVILWNDERVEQDEDLKERITKEIRQIASNHHTLKT